MEKVYDFVVACCGLKRRISDMKVKKILNRGHTKRSPSSLKEERRGRSGTAEGVTRTQWRKATRKMHGRVGQGERRRMRKNRRGREKIEKIEEGIRSSHHCTK